MTGLYTALRSAERFGMSPEWWLSQSAEMRQMMLDFERVRQAEEAREVGLIAGLNQVK